MSNRRLALFVLFAAVVLPYFVNLGATSIIDSNEAFYTETPREMIEAGDYVNPTFNYEPRINKPPLSYWVIAGFYRFFGVSLTAARLPVALGAMVMLVTVFVLGRIAGSARAGLIATLTLAAAPRFLLFSRRIIIDIYSAMFLGLTLLFFVLAETQPQRRRRWLVAMYVATGLGVLTKGPVAIVLPALVFLVYLVASRRLTTITRMMLPTGILVVSVIVVPYYALLYAQHGWDAISSFLMRENVARYAEGIGAPNRGPLFYLATLFADLYFPWSLLLPAGFALVPWRDIWRARLEQPADGGVMAPVSQRTIRLLLGLWIVLIVVFFSLSKAQQDLYILPCIVSAAALVGCLLDDLLGRRLAPKLRAAATWSVGLIALVLVVLGGAVALVAGGDGGWMHVAGSALIGGVLCAASIAALAALARRSAAAACVSLGVAMVIVHWVLVLWALPDFERYKPVPHLARAIQTAAPPGARVGAYIKATPSLTFYLQRHIDQMFDLPALSAFFNDPSPAYCVMEQSKYEPIKDLIGVPTFVLADSPYLDARLSDFLDRKPLPKLVVVTNRPPW